MLIHGITPLIYTSLIPSGFSPKPPAKFPDGLICLWHPEYSLWRLNRDTQSPPRDYRNKDDLSFMERYAYFEIQHVYFPQSKYFAFAPATSPEDYYRTILGTDTPYFQYIKKRMELITSPCDPQTLDLIYEIAKPS